MTIAACAWIGAASGDAFAAQPVQIEAAQPTAVPVVVVSGAATALGLGATIAGIVQADAGDHPYLVGPGLGLLAVGVPAGIASLTTEEPTTMASPETTAGGVAVMALGSGLLGTGVVATGGAGDGAGIALILGGAATWTGGLVLTLVGNHDEPTRAERRAATKPPEPTPEPGSLTGAGEAGRVMTISGIALIGVGGVIALVGLSESGGEPGSLDGIGGGVAAIGGGIAVGTGALVTAVGAPLWATGSVDGSPTPSVSVGPGSVELHGVF